MGNTINQQKKPLSVSTSDFLKS